jgi:V/A-type H+-transporting ATPase subunit E
MTGIEKILKAIEADAAKNANEIIAKANMEANEIKSAALAQAEKKCAEIAKKSESDVKAVLSRADSAAELAEKKILLDAKQQLINHVVQSARNSLRDLPDTDYTDVILRMVKKYAHNEAGKIVFSSYDKKRLPRDFEKLLTQALSEKENAALSVSGDDAGFDGGFLLLYGDIEENCSFDAVFAAAREDLKDMVNNFLFLDKLPSKDQVTD